MFFFLSVSVKVSLTVGRMFLDFCAGVHVALRVNWNLYGFFSFFLWYYDSVKTFLVLWFMPKYLQNRTPAVIMLI